MIFFHWTLSSFSGRWAHSRDIHAFLFHCNKHHFAFTYLLVRNEDIRKQVSESIDQDNSLTIFLLCLRQVVGFYSDENRDVIGLFLVVVIFLKCIWKWLFFRMINIRQSQKWSRILEEEKVSNNRVIVSKLIFVIDDFLTI